jgi:glycosyltransferase involved in cell wall biosynthesis
MKNVLFVLHGDFVSNSAQHVHALANELCRLDCDCAVAIDGDPATYAALNAPLYRPYTYAEALRNGVWFENGSQADIVHAWTPREKIRRFCEGLRAWGHPFQLVVHLEDNEDELLHTALGKTARELRGLDEAQLDALIPDHLSHPIRAARFLEEAAGVTLLIERLGEFAPRQKPTCVFWPAADASLFYPRPPDNGLRESLGIPADRAVLVYIGNVHPANHREVRSLYVAAAMLNREGRKTTLVRTGENYHPFLEQESDCFKDCVIHLGRVERKLIPELLALADALVQPGRAGAFNDYRFPSKLPEFFAMGKPVILPATNIGLHTEHKRHAYVLPQADALGIVEAVEEILDDAPLKAALEKGALEFAASHFSWQRSAEKVFHFYERLGNPHGGKPATASLNHHV